MSGQWRIDYVLYRNSEFSCTTYAESQQRAEQITNGLRKLKHVSDVHVTPPESGRPIAQA